MTSPRPFTYSVVASTLHDTREVDAITADLRRTLDELGGRPGEPHRTPGEPHLVLVATGGTERAALELAARRRAVAPRVPAVLVAHGGHNSLPAALEALAALHQDGQRGLVHWFDGGPEAAVELDRVVADLTVVHRLAATTIGLVGGASDWLVASSPDPEQVTATWGPTVRVIGPERLTEPSEAGSAAHRDLLARFEARTASTVPEPEIAAAADVGAVLRRLVEDEGLDAVAVRCFDLLESVETSGCLALAALNDDRIVAGCEGDLPSTLAMLLVHHLLDRPAWMANPARLDRSGNRVELAHCTIAPSMVEDYELTTHFESGIGVGIGGHFTPQPVTLLRIGGRDLTERWVAEGRILASGDDADLCRTQATVELTDASVDELLTRPLGNHIVLAAGHHCDRLERWFRLAFGA